MSVYLHTFNLDVIPQNFGTFLFVWKSDWDFSKQKIWKYFLQVSGEVSTAV